MQIFNGEQTLQDVCFVSCLAFYSNCAIIFSRNIIAIIAVVFVSLGKNMRTKFLIVVNQAKEIILRLCTQREFARQNVFEMHLIKRQLLLSVNQKYPVGLQVSLKNNRPFPSSCLPPLQSESKCKGISFHSYVK